MIKLTTPLTRDMLANLKAGDEVYLSGIIYTGRDAAHKRLIELLDSNQDLPFDLKNQVIYYVGPTPTKPGQIIGSGGPTTSGRMDKYAPRLISLGLLSMIGKGYRNNDVKESIVKYGGIYFGAIGGAGALISKAIKSCEIIAFEDLGPEAIRRLEVEDFPLVVVIDSKGNNLYEQGRKNYLENY